jgi:hypothetical protein
MSNERGAPNRLASAARAVCSPSSLMIS